MTSAGNLLLHYGFTFVALVIFLGEIGVPVLVPGELALMLAGSRLISSPVQLLVVCMALAAVDLTATTILYSAARTGGNRLLRIFLRRVLTSEGSPEQVLERWRRRLRGHDAAVIFTIRIIPGIRISAPLASGILRLPLAAFEIGAAPASLLWVGVPLSAGYLAGSHLSSVPLPDARAFLAAAIAIATAFLLGGAVWWIGRQRGHTTGDSSGAGRRAA